EHARGTALACRRHADSGDDLRRPWHYSVSRQWTERGSMNASLSYLYRTSAAAALGDLSVADLLRRFAAGTGPAETAFAVLVRRHGPTVLRVCQANLRHGPDAEDAFQATFLILAQKARSLRLRGPLGPWLHEVARRVCAHARATIARRRRHERRCAVAEAYELRLPEPDLPTVVHDALARLPRR